MTNFEILKKIVLESSKSDKWDEAVLEWDISGCYVDNECKSQCICTKTGLKFCYTISNIETNEELTPIGSSCINRFDVFELSEKADFIQRMILLADKSYNGELIEITNKDIFSRKLIDKLFYCQAFSDDDNYCLFDAEGKYRELKSAFNTRNAYAFEVSNIINKEIIPFARKIKRFYAPVKSFQQFAYPCSALSVVYLNRNLVRLSFPADAARENFESNLYVDVKLPFDLYFEHEALSEYNNCYITCPKYIEPSNERRSWIKDKLVEVVFVIENKDDKYSNRLPIYCDKYKKIAIEEEVNTSSFIAEIIDNGAKTSDFMPWSEELKIVKQW